MKADFYQNVAIWKKHVEKASIYSFPNALILCDAFDNLVNMGISILPLIFIEYQKSTDVPWGDLLARITGINLGNYMEDDEETLRDKWMRWGENRI